MFKNLSNYTDQELANEIDRRTNIKKQRERERHIKSHVNVTCPFCNGTGKLNNPDIIRVASGETDEYIKCPLCKGNQTIVVPLRA